MQVPGPAGVAREAEGVALDLMQPVDRGAAQEDQKTDEGSGTNGSVTLGPMQQADPEADAGEVAPSTPRTSRW